MLNEPDLAGKQLGRYRVVALLGSGGMGAVYDALDPDLGRHVALKVLPPEFVANPGRLQRFVREARAAASLNHPHLVSIHEIGSTELDGHTLHFIAMEKIDGSTLRDVLRRERLPLRSALELTEQIGDAVAAAHAMGIVHRDLKPENIMIAANGYAKVLDFGLAKLRSDEEEVVSDVASTQVLSTESGIILGTVGYMAPEQAQGKPADHRSDVFALGCVLYEMVTGKRAFQGRSSIETLQQIIHADPEPIANLRPDVPSELQRIIRKATAKEPDERYQSAKDLAVDVRALARDLAAPAPVASPHRPIRRRIGVPVMAGVALAVILIGIAAVVALRRGAAVPATSQTAFRRLTAAGNLHTVTISPDGRFIAYTNDDGSLWLRQLASGEDLQLLPRAPVSFLGTAFTPDGDAIIYATISASEPRGALHRISTIGGTPQHLLSGADSAPALSPDGKRMAWFRAAFPSGEESALMIANIDGSDARIVAVRRRPEQFVPVFFSRPAWSPDGRLIAAAVKRLRDPNSAALIGFDPDSRAEVSLSSASWASLSSLAWLPDQKGIVAIAAADQASIHGVSHTGNQIWLIPYPTGAPRRITNDLLYYREVSVSADGTKLVADVADAVVHLWRTPLDGDERPQRISSGHFDGVGGVSAIGDRVVFTSTERGTTSLWSMDADGGKRKQLIRKPYREEYPVAFTGGIAYVSNTPAATELCVTSAEGEGRRVVASGIDDAPVAVSAQGDWFAYTINERLWSTAGSGTPVQLTEVPTVMPAFSPAGDRIAFIAGDPQNGPREIVVLHSGDWKPVWRSPRLQQHSVSWLRWQPDGNAILVGSWGGQIWQYPINGEPKRLARFEGTLWSFEPTGANALLVARGTVTRDAVLITGFR